MTIAAMHCGQEMITIEGLEQAGRTTSNSIY
jgi:hypothetical protein